MILFDGHKPEERVQQAAYKATWEVVGPLDGVAIDDDTIERAWAKCFPAAVTAGDKAKPPLLDDLVRLHANKGFRRALDQWYERLDERRATRRHVIVETGHDAAQAMFARFDSESEVRLNRDAIYEATLPQARWLNDGDLALAPGPFDQAVYEGVVLAADERIGALRTAVESEAAWKAAREAVRTESVEPAAAAGGEPKQRTEEEQRAFGTAIEVASEVAARVLSGDGEGASQVVSESYATDAAVAAVETLPDTILEAMDDDDQIDATLEGVARAVREAGPDPALRSSAGTAKSTATRAAAAAARGAGTAYDRVKGAAASVGPAAGRVAASAGPAASSAASAAARRARTERDRLALARRAKAAVDPLLPEATGEPLPQAVKQRAYAAAREAAMQHNDAIGRPFSSEEATRIADLTTKSVLGTWAAMGHLRNSGLAEKATDTAKASAARLLTRYGIPSSVGTYLVDEAVRIASPGWAGGSGKSPASGVSSGARGTTFKGRPVPNYYELLQVSPKASSAMIDRAWRLLVAQSHPDQGGDAERTVLLNEARDVLVGAETREAYDRENGF